MFSALRLYQTEAQTLAKIEDLEEQDLPDEQVLIYVKYSSVNYKDALAVTGEGKIVRSDFPFVPGIDLAGEVVSSNAPAFSAGDKVIGNGWGLGESNWGGYAQKARVKAKSLIRMPEGLSYQHAMALGTAGFTAMLSVMALEEHNVTPDKGEVVVTGATGGVGTISIILLSQSGYEVVASTGKRDAIDYLKMRGATRIIDRSVLGAGAVRPLDTGIWAGAIDNVGGPALAALISQIKTGGSIASCGLANSASLETTVYPFILRGVNLLGIDSGTCSDARRQQAWRRLRDTLPPSIFDEFSRVVPLSEVPEICKMMMAGKVQGRIVVDVNH